MNREASARELRWFFRESSGELGLKSNFSSMVARLEGGDVHPLPGIDGRAIEAAHRARVVRRVLDALPGTVSAVLERAFGDDAGGLCNLAAVMVHSAEVLDAHVRSKSKRPVDEWLDRLAESSEPDRRRLFVLLKGTAERSVDAALTLFSQAEEDYRSLWRDRVYAG